MSLFASGFAKTIYHRIYLQKNSEHLLKKAAATRTQRAVSRMEKSINNAMRSEQKLARADYASKVSQRNLFATVLADEKASATYSSLFNEGGGFNQEVTKTDEGQALYKDFMAQVESAKIQQEQAFQALMAEIESQFELEKEMRLEPLKEEGEDLEIEAENLKTEAEMAKATWEEAKKMQEENIKNMWA